MEMPQTLNVTPNPKHPENVKAKILSSKPIESDILNDLGAEIEEELTAEQKSKQSPEEQITNFMSSEEMIGWKEYQNSGESEAKTKAKNKVINKLDQLKSKLPEDSILLDAVRNIREMIEHPKSNA